MNKELFNQLPVDERSVAEKLNSVSENMKVSQAFQWTLESQLMDAYQNKSQPNKGWFSKLIIPAAWTLAAVLGFIILTWTIRSLASPEQITPAAPNIEIPVETFESKVRQGNICEGPLALAHGFEVSLTNEDKTDFLPVDTEDTLWEVRSFAWSADGDQLAVIGNYGGGGGIYIVNLTDGGVGNFLSASETGYLRDANWSGNGRQIVLWSSRHINTLYLLNTLGHGMIEKQLDVQILGTPQFTPNGRSIFFYGADSIASGLFTLTLEGLQPILIIPTVEDENGFAFSPDGSLLAYMEYDRELGEARLSTQNLSKGEYKLLGKLPIPKGSGAAMPETTNLSWSQDGTKLVFEFGGNAADRAIYLAYADGSGLVKVVESAYAPTISADGNCLAYIDNKQVFILDIKDVSPTSNSATPFPLVDLPTAKSGGDFRLDKLQWRP